MYVRVICIAYIVYVCVLGVYILYGVCVCVCCVCVCMYVCIYIYTHTTYIHIYIHTHLKQNIAPKKDYLFQINQLCSNITADILLRPKN